MTVDSLQKPAPAMLTEPLTLTLGPETLDMLNAYRQAAHAVYHPAPGLSSDQLALLVTEHRETAHELAGWLDLDVRAHLGEPIGFD